MFFKTAVTAPELSANKAVVSGASSPGAGLNNFFFLNYYFIEKDLYFRKFTFCPYKHRWK